MNDKFLWKDGDLEFAQAGWCDKQSQCECPEDGSEPCSHWHEFKIASIEEIVAYLRAQAKMRAPENDEAGILRQYAYRIELEVDKLSGRPLPFAGLDAHETE